VSCPGLWSLTNKYSGIPPYVTCVPPSGREIVPSLLALTPLPAVAELTPAGSSKGGHSVAQEEVHMIVPPLSDANSYSVNPLESTSTVPAPGTDFVPMTTEPGCAPGELLPLELGAAFLAQADNAISVATDAIQTGRVVLDDEFTFVLLRAGGLESGRPSSWRIRNWGLGRVPGPVHSSLESQGFNEMDLATRRSTRLRSFGRTQERE
jgi:hypothetical protein